MNGGEDLLILLLDLDGFDQHFEQPAGIIHYSFLLIGRRKERRYVEARPQVHSFHWVEDPATHMLPLILGTVVVFVFVHLGFHEHSVAKSVSSRRGAVSTKNGGVQVVEP